MVSLITDATLARLRGYDARTMRSSCRVLRRVDTVAGGRVASGAETQVGPTVVCRRRTAELRPREGEAVGRLGEETFGSVDLPLGVTDLEVLSGDRIEVTTVHGSAVSVETFEVAGDPVPDSYDTCLTVELTRED